LLADAIAQRADKVMLDYTADAVAVKYEIDGLWHNANPKVHEKEPLTRQLGDHDAGRREADGAPQYERAPRPAGGKVQARVRRKQVRRHPPEPGNADRRAGGHLRAPITKHSPTLEDLGMRDKLRERLKELIGPGAKGMVAFVALPGGRADIDLGGGAQEAPIG
jgi:hypothetical protein